MTTQPTHLPHHHDRSHGQPLSQPATNQQSLEMIALTMKYTRQVEAVLDIHICPCEMCQNKRVEIALVLAEFGREMLDSTSKSLENIVLFK